MGWYFSVLGRISSNDNADVGLIFSCLICDFESRFSNFCCFFYRYRHSSSDNWASLPKPIFGSQKGKTFKEWVCTWVGFLISKVSKLVIHLRKSPNVETTHPVICYIFHIIFRANRRKILHYCVPAPPSSRYGICARHYRSYSAHYFFSDVIHCPISAHPLLSIRCFIRCRV